MIDALGAHTLRHFTLDEFACPCCGSAQMNGNFLVMLDKARDVAGIPFVVNSGYRCERHNRTLKGARPDSSHITGRAADIAVTGSRQRFAVIDAAREVGFMRIGVAKSFVHLDNDDGKPQGVAWVYK